MDPISIFNKNRHYHHIRRHLFNMTNEKMGSFFRSTLNRNRSSIIRFLGISTTAALFIKIFYNTITQTSDSDTLSKNLDEAAKKLGLRGSNSFSSNDKLISVQIVTRHGARTPLNIVSTLEQAEYTPDLLQTFVKAKFISKSNDNTDMNKLVSKYDYWNIYLKGGAGKGQLTFVGEEQMFKLGRRFKQRYIDELKFISPIYNTNEVYVRSSHFKRTINSAKCVLAGIYAESPRSELADNPFIINVYPVEIDIIYPNSANCLYLSEIGRFLTELDIVMKHDEYMTNLKLLNKQLGILHKENETSFTHFRDDMIARKAHGLPYPKELEVWIEKSDRYAAMEMAWHLDHNIKISCGKFLTLINENIMNTIKNDQNNKDINFHKFRYFSAHDSTLKALLLAFGLVNVNNDKDLKWPPFGADIIVELWKRHSETENTKNSNLLENYYICVYYCGNKMAIPNCSNSEKECNLQRFIDLLKKSSVDELTYVEMCKQSFKN